MRIGPIDLYFRTRSLRPAGNPGEPHASISFHCNICGNFQTALISRLAREDPSCDRCGSNVRFRAIVDLVSKHFFGRSIPLPEFPVRREIVGLGLSDWAGYAVPFAHCFSYTNTHFHKSPRVDIANPPQEMLGRHDFLVSSDVFEHVMPPAQAAFDGAYGLLKPGGVLALTVPFLPGVETSEHFPEAVGYEVVSPVEVKLELRDGSFRTIHEPNFHGGPGATLEMRLFGEAGIRDCLTKAGFGQIVVHGTSTLEHGIAHGSNCSLPITAIKP